METELGISISSYSGDSFASLLDKPASRDAALSTSNIKVHLTALASANGFQEVRRQHVKILAACALA